MTRAEAYIQQTLDLDAENFSDIAVEVIGLLQRAIRGFEEGELNQNLLQKAAAKCVTLAAMDRRAYEMARVKALMERDAAGGV